LSHAGHFASAAAVSVRAPPLGHPSTPFSVRVMRVPSPVSLSRLRRRHPALAQPRGQGPVILAERAHPRARSHMHALAPVHARPHARKQGTPVLHRPTPPSTITFRRDAAAHPSALVHARTSCSRGPRPHLFGRPLCQGTCSQPFPANRAPRRATAELATVVERILMLPRGGVNRRVLKITT
jgi:hypothetical protein